MNFFEKLGLFIIGPYYPKLFNFYGEWLWMFLFLFPLNLQTIIILVAIHVVLNLYQLQTQEPILNATFGTMPEEIISAIAEKASRDCIAKHSSLYVTNYPSINAFCSRNLNNCKIIISHHWFESHEKKQYLNAILEHEFGHAREHHNLKAFIINSFLFTAGITCCYLSTLFVEPTQDTTTYFLLFNFIIFRMTTFLQTRYTQHNEYQADAQALTYISPQKMISALLFLKANSSAEQIRENQPSWIGTHPKISDRIKAIEKISQKNTDIL